MRRALAMLLLLAAAPLPIDPALRPLLKSPSACPKVGYPDAILVCGRDREAERQTLPLEADPGPGDQRTTSVSRERNALVEDGTGEGSLHCDSAVGAAAGSGCLARDHRRAKQQEAGRDHAPK